MVKKVTLFGLNANRGFSDIVDREEALENLGLKVVDLDIIRDSSQGDNPVSRNDVKSAAGLNVPVQRYLSKLISDTQQYKGIIDQTAGSKEQLKGNLIVNGSLAASAIKYSYLEQGTNLIKGADISTSRVSSWSSPDAEPTDFSPIFYGGDVQVGGTLTANNIQILNPPQEVKFPESEVPTHQIQAVINGETVYLYAMKGIPLVFEGFFRNFDTTFELITAGALSLRIVDVNTPVYTKEYKNLGGASTTQSTLLFRDTRASLKQIEVYHDPNNIKTLRLNLIGLEFLPAAELEGLQTLTLYRNSIRDFPDIATFGPNLRSLDIRENNFTLGDDPLLRKFNNNVLSRLPTSLTSLTIGNTFDGSITADIRNTLTQLTSFSVGSHSRGGARQFFSADTDDPAGALPEVPDTVTSYTADYNAFKSLPQTIKQLPDLAFFNIYGNDVTDRNFFIDSDKIEYVNTGGGNQMNVADMRNKSALKTYYSHYQYGGAYTGGGDINGLVNPDGSYKFENCANLELIYLYASYYRGPIPKFAGNPKLNRVELGYTQVSGGKSDTEQEFTLYPDIFDDCADTMRTFRIISSFMLAKPMASDVFSKCKNMYYIDIRSYGRGNTGNVPDLSGMPGLTYLLMLQNRLDGTIENSFVNNTNLYYIHLYGNRLTGKVPAIESTRLYYLYLHYNQFDEFTGIFTPNLRRLFLSVNQITGAIPDLSNLVYMYDCYLNNNLFDSYTKGSFAPLTSLRRLDLSNNSNLSESSVNDIIDDMYQNYQTKPRSGVSVNVRNTAIPTGDAIEQIEFLRSKGWNIRT